jgi:hypothetical protein
LEYALGATRSYVWVIGKTSFDCFELPAQAVIEEKAARLHTLLSAPPEEAGNEPSAAFDRLSSELSELLLCPVAPALAGQRLLIVADGALNQVPFSVLPLPNRAPGQRKLPEQGKRSGRVPLLAQHEVVNLPSFGCASGIKLSPRHIPKPRTRLPSSPIRCLANTMNV